MLGWFKKKFKKKEDDTAVSAADLKIPVAPRTFGTDTLLHESDIPTQAEAEQPVLPAEAETVAEPISIIDIDTMSEVPEEIEEQADLKGFDDLRSDISTPIYSEHDEFAYPTAIASAELESSVHAPEPKPEIEQEPEAEQSAIFPDETEETEDTYTDDVALQSIDESIADVEADNIAEEETKLYQASPPVPLEVSSQKIPVVPRIETIQPVETKPAAKKKPFLARLTERLLRTRETFTYQLDTLFLGKKVIDAKLLDDLEELLITADLGVSITQEILDHARKKVKRNELSDPNSLRQVLKDKLKTFIVDYQEDAALVMPKEGPFVIMVIGVNGVGKTTTIGKIAHKFLQSGQSVLLVAADTFRAAAISQLKIWGERNNIPVITKKEGSDPSAVVFDGLAHAKAKGYDVVLVDTAGRLHTQANLMEELKKIKRVMAKQLDGAPHEVMLVIDATTGQNGISQAKLFDAAVNLTGITLTKLDGTAKGGIVANICKELKTPIRFIGVGEQLEDLRDFDPEEFIEALFKSASDITE